MSPNHDTSNTTPQGTPSASLLAQLAQELMVHPPFTQMQPEHVRSLIAHSEQRYYADAETVMQPADGPVQVLLYLRSGSISGTQGLAQLAGGAFLYEAGDVFPVSAVMGERAVTATYRATEDTFVMAIPVATVQAVAKQSAVLADFLNRRIQQFLDLSRKALQDEHASRVLAEQSLETSLGELGMRAPVTCRPDAPLRQVLTAMQAERIGSMLVTGSDGQVLGILSRYDVLDKVTLPAVPLDTPISRVMSSPVHCLDTQATAHDAALLMSRLGVRHVPITHNGRAVGLVSERDLFAMQRLSLQQLSSALRSAPGVATLQSLAPDIRRFAQRLLGQGVQARQLTGLISHLNDLLTQRLLDLLAAQHGLHTQDACWLALGSEGRDEQTIATDQDNALVLADSVDDAARERWLTLALEANHALDACGYPLCAGKVMASNPELCLRANQWKARFAHWMSHGEPEDLLNASIFFDLRSLWGQHDLAQGLIRAIAAQAPQSPRFLKLLALNALQRSAPITWTGAIDTDSAGYIDLKLRGTAIFVDAARFYALAHGISETNTRARLQAIGQKLGAKQREYEGWISGFEFLQTLRLRVQMDGQSDPDAPNSIAVRSLNTIDRRILKETFRLAQELQQRMKMDYDR